MNRRYNPWYFVTQTLKGIYRNGIMSATSILVLVSMLTVMGGFWILVKTIDTNLSSLQIMNDIVVMMDASASDEDVEKTEKMLSNMKEYGLGLDDESGNYVVLDEEWTGSEEEHISLSIDTIQHVTKEEALAQLKATDPDLYSDINDENNPLPEKFVIQYSDAEKVETITMAIWDMNQYLSGDMIKTVKGYEQLVNTITTLRSGVMYVLTWFLVILAVVSVFIIINTVKLSVFSRKQEIMIMRYVGATKTFIALPFLGEGFLIGLISSIVAFFIEKAAYQGVLRLLETSDAGSMIQLISVLPFSSVSVSIFFGFLLLGLTAGLLGSEISLLRYIKT